MKHVVVMFTLLFGASIAHAAGTFYAIDDELKTAKQLIYKERYKQAIEKLQEAVDSEPDNADAWNLLGYASRKKGDLERSAEAYGRALDIDPEHKDALQYQGELYLTLGDKKAADANLTQLKLLCPDGCEQLELLMDAIAAK